MKRTEEENEPEETDDMTRKDELPDTKAAHDLMKCNSYILPFINLRDLIFLYLGFLLSLSYSASIGGSGSLVGTAPNLILKGFFDEYYPEAGLNFFTFILYSVPAASLMIISSWLALSFLWLPRKYLVGCFRKNTETKNSNNRLTDFIRTQYENLGPLR